MFFPGCMRQSVTLAQKPAGSLSWLHRLLSYRYIHNISTINKCLQYFSFFFALVLSKSSWPNRKESRFLNLLVFTLTATKVNYLNLCLTIQQPTDFNSLMRQKKSFSINFKINWARSRSASSLVCFSALKHIKKRGKYVGMSKKSSNTTRNSIT